MKLPLLLLAAAATISPASAATNGKPVVFQTESRVEVDAQGHIVSSKTTPELPEAAQATVDAELRRLRFAPAHVDGKPVGGVTYVKMDACAAPENGAYRLAVKYRGNGPSPEKNYVPSYPKAPERAGVQATWRVSYDIGRDGTTSAAEFERIEGSGGRFDRDFRAMLGKWVEAMRYRPEIVDGQPVSTRMTQEVAFRLDAGMDFAAALKAAQDRAASGEACQLAMADADDPSRPVALNSPFRRLPAD